MLKPSINRGNSWDKPSTAAGFRWPIHRRCSSTQWRSVVGFQLCQGHLAGNAGLPQRAARGMTGQEHAKMYMFMFMFMRILHIICIYIYMNIYIYIYHTYHMYAYIYIYTCRNILSEIHVYDIVYIYIHAKIMCLYSLYFNVYI